MGFRFVFPGVFLELPAGSASEQVVDGVDQPVLGHGVAPEQLDTQTSGHSDNLTIEHSDNRTIGHWR